MIIKRILYFFEFTITFIIIFIFKFFPMNFVSLIGGRIFQSIGPFTKSHKTAISNINIVFPNLNKKEKEKIVYDSWNNLGKTFSEFIILDKILNKKNNRIKISGLDYLNEIKKKNEQVIFFGIHQSNWEILVPTMDNLGINVGAIYRHINNPHIDKLINKIRKKNIKNQKTFYTPKGKESAKAILSAVISGQSIILLIDQKDSAGNIINLFNHEVKTQIGFLKIAKKNNLKLVPIQNIRKKINNFELIFHQPINPFENNDKNEIDVMNDIHKIIENWIIHFPKQWFWQHNRFN